MIDEDAIRTRYEAMTDVLDERARRLFLGAEAKAAGRGGQAAVARATGASVTTIRRGLGDLLDGAFPAGRVRRPGGGRKRTVERDPTILADLEALIEPGTRGDPESPLRWTTRSVRNLADDFGRMGHSASHQLVSELYAERVAVTSQDEIGELAESFNTMADFLEATERRRLELVGDVAHELRTLLATLDGYLEGLEDGIIQPGEATWTLLRGETSRLTRIVNDLQELWRAEARQLSLSPETVDVRSELRAAAERFATEAQEHGIEIRTDIGQGPLTVRADAERLRQVVDNFLSNAIRYSHRDGVVTIAAGRERDEVAISVMDHGLGLTPDQLEHVFERFYRVDPSRSRALGGSGIGLAIARALAVAMGGRVDARSEGEGRGATFRVRLPGA